MKLQQVSDNCFAALNERNRVCDANVERAYREFRNEPADAPWVRTATFDAIYEVARARRCAVEF